MGDLSPHFSRHEFHCKCSYNCGLDSIDAETLAVLEAVRERFGKPVTVVSGQRCSRHNKDVGGAQNSQHLWGRAADIVVKGLDPRDVHGFLLIHMRGKGGVGKYDTFTHVDTRSNGPARW